MTHIKSITKAIEALEDAELYSHGEAITKGNATRQEALTALRALRDAVPDSVRYRIIWESSPMVGNKSDEEILKTAKLLSEAIGE